MPGDSSDRGAVRVPIYRLREPYPEELGALFRASVGMSSVVHCVLILRNLRRETGEADEAAASSTLLKGAH